MKRNVRNVTFSILAASTLFFCSSFYVPNVTVSNDTIVTQEVLDASREINEDLLNMYAIQRIGLFIDKEGIIANAKEETIDEVRKEYKEIQELREETKTNSESKKQSLKNNYHSISEFINNNQELCIYYGIRNEDDLINIIATCYGEDTIYPEEVMCTMINRVESNNFQCYGTTLIEQVTTPSQFVAYRSNNPFFKLYNNPNAYFDVVKKCLDTLIDKYYFNIKRHDYCSFRSGYDINREKIGSNYYFATTSECGGETSKVEKHNASLDSIFEADLPTSRLFEEYDILIELIKNAKDIDSLNKIISLYKIDITLEPSLLKDSQPLLKK